MMVLQSGKATSANNDPPHPNFTRICCTSLLSHCSLPSLDQSTSGKTLWSISSSFPTYYWYWSFSACPRNGNRIKKRHAQREGDLSTHHIALSSNERSRNLWDQALPMHASGFITTALLGVATTAKPLEISDYIRAAISSPEDVPTSSSPSNSTSSNSTVTAEPCAQASEYWMKSEKGEVPADIALNCLRSVPLDSNGDLLQLQGVIELVQFQSTLVR
jgi:hypothetical protein